jgi:FkbM family methyltransferase
MCEDIEFYLFKGYRVVAVDADPRLIERAREVCAVPLREGRLRLLHCAIASEEGEADFHVCEYTYWNSLNQEVSSRHGRRPDVIRVPTRRLIDIFREHGVPYYCKIDIEGNDAVGLESLVGSPDLPRFISVETECTGDRVRLSDSQALRTLDLLQQLGYRRFKLVDQRSLSVLSHDVPVFRERPSLRERVQRRLGLGGYTHYDLASLVTENRRRLSEKHRFDFPESATGPFGDDLEGEWQDYRVAEMTLLRHRRDYFHMSDATKYGFWCDWHATF